MRWDCETAVVTQMLLTLAIFPPLDYSFFTRGVFHSETPLLTLLTTFSRKYFKEKT